MLGHWHGDCLSWHILIGLLWDNMIFTHNTLNLNIFIFYILLGWYLQAKLLLNINPNSAGLLNGAWVRWEQCACILCNELGKVKKFWTSRPHCSWRNSHLKKSVGTTINILRYKNLIWKWKYKRVTGYNKSRTRVILLLCIFRCDSISRLGVWEWVSK